MSFEGEILHRNNSEVRVLNVMYMKHETQCFSTR